MALDINTYSPESGRVIRENNTTVNKTEMIDKLIGAIYTDSDGNFEASIIDVLHVAVHEKKMHTVSKRKNTSVYHRVLLTASATKDIHLRIGYSSEDFIFFNTYSGAIVPTGGSVITAFNRFVGEASNLTCTILYDPTSFTGGDVRGNDFIGQTGAATVRAGGTGSSDIETVVKAGQKLLIEIQRTESGSKYTGMILNLYERNAI
jgi:hypothetical protein